MTVTKRTRYEVLRRDEHTCRYCHATDQPLTVDHVVPVALGGTDDPSNLVAACKDCNAGKSSSSPDAGMVAEVADDAVRWAAAMERAAAEMSGQVSDDKKYAEAFLASWDWGYLPDNWEASVLQMRRAGLPLSDIQYAAKVASSARGIDSRFRYFCGVAWKRLGQIQERARELLKDNDAPDDETGPEWHDCQFCDRKIDIYREDFESDDAYDREVGDARCASCDDAFLAGSQGGYYIGLNSPLRVVAE